MIALVEDAEPSARDIAKLIQQIKIGFCPSDLCRQSDRRSFRQAASATAGPQLTFRLDHPNGGPIS